MIRLFLFVAVLISGALLKAELPKSVRQKLGKYAPVNILYSLGPAKSCFQTLGWMQMQRHEVEFRFFRAGRLASDLTMASPYNPYTWDFLAWNMGFNVAASVSSEEEQYYWVQRAYDSLLEGVGVSARVHRLEFALCQLIYYKMNGGEAGRLLIKKIVPEPRQQAERYWRRFAQAKECSPEELSMGLDLLCSNRENPFEEVVDLARITSGLEQEKVSAMVRAYFHKYKRVVDED